MADEEKEECPICGVPLKQTKGKEICPKCGLCFT